MKRYKFTAAIFIFSFVFFFAFSAVILPLHAETRIDDETAKVMFKTAKQEMKKALSFWEQIRQVGSTEKMMEKVHNKTKEFKGTWSVYFERMDTRECFCLNETPMIAASTIKLYVYGAVMDQIRQGKAKKGVYDEDLREMIEFSSNEAWYYLTDVFGKDTIAKFIKQNGYAHTEIAKFDQKRKENENFTDVYDLGKLLEKVLDGKYVSKECSDSLLNSLKKQYYTHKIPSGIPSGIQTANKTGELDEMEHDAAIIYSPECTYILVIMTKDADPYLIFEQFGILSHEIYEMLNPDGKPMRGSNYAELYNDYYW